MVIALLGCGGREESEAPVNTEVSPRLERPGSRRAAVILAKRAFARLSEPAG